MFYPRDADTLQSMVRGFVEAGGGERPEGALRALIAPHAGYVYSGPVAGSAYALLSPHSGVRRVLLLGPAHHIPVPGLAVPTAVGFATPLGVVAVDQMGVEQASGLDGVVVSDDAHEPEHSLEVQLPFLQERLGEVPVVPLLVGQTSDERVAGVLDALWTGPETLVVISSDLSHYHDHATAKRLDAATAAAIEALEPLSAGDACGRLPINGLLRVAARRGLRATTLDLRNSGDTAGPRNRVVGYGAFAFTSHDGD